MKTKQSFYLSILVFCILCSNFKLVYSYFITVDETKFHLVKSYLCRYGYMNENVCKQHADDSLKFMQNNARDIYRGLVIFQTMFNITRSGKIDEDTIMKMAKPRCGNKDFDLQFSSSKFLSFRTNDYSLLRKGLTKLTYSIRKYNPYLNRFSKSLSNEAVESLVDQAFNTWLKHLYGDVKVKKLNEYEELYDNSNITVYFAEGNHGDSMLFDGIDGELAHSCSLSNTQSPFRGHIHLDDSENWNKGNRLLPVIMHQIGHLFGLDHSSNPKSVMSPLFNFNSDSILEEDIKNLRMILGLESKHRQYQNLKSSSSSSSTLPTTVTTTTTTTTETTSTTTTTTTTTESTTTEFITTTTETVSTSILSTTEVFSEMPNTTSENLSSTNQVNELDESQESEEISTTTEEILTTSAENLPQTSVESTTTTETTTLESQTTSAEETTTQSMLATIILKDLTDQSTTTTLQETTTTTSESEEESGEQTESIITTTNAADTMSSEENEFLVDLLQTTVEHVNITANTTTPIIETEYTTTLPKTVSNTPELTTSQLTTSEPETESDSNEENEDMEYQELLKLIGTTQTPGLSTTTSQELISTSSKLEQDQESSTHQSVIENSNSTAAFLFVTSSEKLAESTESDDYFSSENDTVSAIINLTAHPTENAQPHTTQIISTSTFIPETSTEISTTDIESTSTTTESTTTVEITTETTTTTTSTTTTTTTTTSTTSSSSTQSLGKLKFSQEDLEQPADLCNDPEVDAITRTEWGNALIFKGNYIWHIRGLTKWRLFDYEGWPKRISALFPGLPGSIDSAYLYDDQYHFTKNQTIWKYKIVLSYPPKYVLVKGYPRALRDEYPDMPFRSVDSAFSIASSIFFFKDYEFWQSDWNSNVTGKIPFKTNAAVSWRNPRLDNSLTEPLAYIVSNSSMYKFNYWSIPISQEALDIRYFLFDCVQANYKPHNPLFLGPSYKQAFLVDDVYSKEVKSARQIPAYLARMVRNSNEKNRTLSSPLVQDNSQILIKSLMSMNSTVKLNCSFIFLVISLFFNLFIFKISFRN